MPSLIDLSRRYLAEALLASAILFLVAFWPRPPKQPDFVLDTHNGIAMDSTPPEAAAPTFANDSVAIRGALSAAFGEADSIDPEPRFAGELPEIEKMVVALLRQGRDADAINRWLASLPGYQGPQSGQGTTIGEIQFFDTIERERPSYLLLPLAVDRPEQFALMLNFPSVNGPSLFAVLGRDGGGWHVGFRHQSERQIEAFVLALESGSPLLVAFDRHWRADGSEGVLHAWRLTEPQPEEIPLGLPELQDADIATTDSTVTVVAAQFLGATQDCIMCTRRGTEVTVLAGAVPTVTTRELTPWVEVVDSFYTLLAAGRPEEAKGLLADGAFFRALVTGRASAESDAGSLERGIGEVTLRLEGSGKHRYVRVTCGVQPDGEWRIVRVAPERR